MQTNSHYGTFVNLISTDTQCAVTPSRCSIKGTNLWQETDRVVVKLRVSTRLCLMTQPDLLVLFQAGKNTKALTWKFSPTEQGQ